MNRLENPNNPCIDPLKNAMQLRVRRVGNSLCLMAVFESKPFGLYQGVVSTLEAGR